MSPQQMERAPVTAETVDWRSEVLDLLADDLYALDFLAAVATDLGGGDPAAGMHAVGPALEHLADACDWLVARDDEHLRRLRDLKPYRNLTLPERRRIDTAPVRFARNAELRAAMVRHHRLLPELEALAVRALAAAALAYPRT